MTDHAENPLLGTGIQWGSKGESMSLQAGQLPSFSACCGSSGGSQPALLVAVPGALGRAGLCCTHQKLQACKKQVSKSVTLSWSRPRAEITPQPRWHVLGPCPRPCWWPQGTRGGGGNARAPQPGCRAAPCAPHCQPPSPGLLGLPAPALHCPGSVAPAGSPAGSGRGDIQFPLCALVPQGPAELLLVVAQSWALTPRSHSKAAQVSGTECCVEELKQVVPLAGHKAEASYRCLLQVTSGPSYGHGYGKELGWMGHPGLFSSTMSL